MNTRNGKIARLPRHLRDQLNHRLHDGESGDPLLQWLNGLPEVKKLLAQHFEGQPISKQNLSEWRTGGFAEWQTRQEALEQAKELAADATELQTATAGKLADHLATVIASRYATLLASWDGEVTEDFTKKLRVLRGLTQDIAELRRGEQHSARIAVQQQRLELERQKTGEFMETQFAKWAKLEKNRNKFYPKPKPMTREEEYAEYRRIFGIATDAYFPDLAPKSDPVKPRQTETHPDPDPAANSSTEPSAAEKSTDCRPGTRAGHPSQKSQPSGESAATKSPAPSKPVKPGQTKSNHPL